jgi:hypothetical protein
MIFHIETENWFWFMISILASWRLTCLICFDSGPFDIMNLIRNFLFQIKLGTLIDCFHCTSFWVSAILVCMLYTLDWEICLLVLGVSGGASWLERMLGHSQNQTPV